MDDVPIFHIEGAIPFLLLLDGETKTLEILAAAMALSFWKIVPIITIYSVDTFFNEKEKVYIFHIYFQIAMFLKTGVYNIYAYIKLISLESCTDTTLDCRIFGFDYWNIIIVFVSRDLIWDFWVPSTWLINIRETFDSKGTNYNTLLLPASLTICSSGFNS